MIKTKSGVISRQVADAGCASLDEEVARKRTEGKLDPGQKTVEYLSWTTETYKAAQDFESSLDLTGLESLGITTSEASGIKWVGPFIYGDVLNEPLRYSSSASGQGVIGILALGDLNLPDVGNSAGVSISGGSVAYFRRNDPVVYKSCSGRGILFHISN